MKSKNALQDSVECRGLCAGFFDVFPQFGTELGMGAFLDE
jgi:hypothetical protein